MTFPNNLIDQYDQGNIEGQQSKKGVNSTSFEDSFNKIAENNNENESWYDFTTRNISQKNARVGEMLLGAPRTIKKQFTQFRDMLESSVLSKEDEKISTRKECYW